MKSKKTSIRFIANLLTLMLVFSCTVVNASATQARSSTCISSYAGAATRTSAGVVISFDITARSTMNTLGAATIVIEKKSGNDWTPVKTFYSSSTAGMTSSNTIYHCGEVTYSGASASATYRGRITFYAADSTKSDSKVLTTYSC